MRQTLKAGATLDLLTKGELDESMGHNFDAAIRDILRGVDYLWFSGNGQSATTVEISGPESGYCWSIKFASVQLAAAGQFCVYLGENTASAPIASIASDPLNQAIATWTSNVVVLKDSRNLTFFSNGGGIVDWKLMVKQVPTEMQGKL
jgi:hypothetical protein